MNAPDLFDTSAIFNLRGEALDDSPTAEGQARAAAQAESEARKAQTAFPICEDAAEIRRTLQGFGIDGKSKTPGPIQNPRTQPYSGPFPRKRHAHRCERCGRGRSVACYKSQCTRPRVTKDCQYCREYPQRLSL